MEDFLDDFKDFIGARLQQPLFDIEQNIAYQEKFDNYKLYYTTLKERLKKEDIQLLENLICAKETIEDFYIDISYRTGFTDGFKMKDSIKKESKE